MVFLDALKKWIKFLLSLLAESQETNRHTSHFSKLPDATSPDGGVFYFVMGLLGLIGDLAAIFTGRIGFQRYGAGVTLDRENNPQLFWACTAIFFAISIVLIAIGLASILS